MKKIFLVITVLIMAFPVFAATVSSSIPMSVEIAKQCTFSNVTSEIILQEDGSDTTAGYTVTCNTPYSIFTDNAKWYGGWYSYISNTQNEQLKTGVGTRAVYDNAQVTLHAGIPLARSGYSIDDYEVSIHVSTPITATTRAGVYTDTYLITVDY
ncbi:hypothetical protein [Acinetobacter bohemicus]|uniref:hypothetical protein n=1 Tax=Acinetobacter bohemicus TaxID=1435036 RepID=UPI004042802D